MVYVHVIELVGVLCKVILYVAYLHRIMRGMVQVINRFAN